MTEKDKSSEYTDFEKERPTRSYMEDPNITWRNGKPNYMQIDKMYLEGRTKNHFSDSLEKTVENLVKTWEMEATHKPNYKDWESVDPDVFVLNMNNVAKYDGETLSKVGSYNLLLRENPLYDPSGEETFESSHKLFRGAFKEGFAWELLETFTGPPRVVFSWRHWGKWTGAYRGHGPTGEILTLYGIGIAVVNDQLKLTSIDLYLDSNPIIAKLEGKDKTSVSNLASCPFHNQMKS